ncbi:MAG: AraC-like DNA-binding protein [Verrucomicrobiales bacterium]|jgi:AraC-like DNA-binding protein
MKSIPLTRTATLSPFVHYLSERNGSVTAGLGAVGIDPEMLADPEGLIPLKKVSGFIDHVMRMDGIEDLSLRVGTATPVSSLGLFGKAIEQSLTLKDIVEKLQRYVPLLDSGARVWMEENSLDTFRLCLRHDVGIGRAQADAYGMTMMIDAVRIACGSDWRPARVALDLESGRLAHQHEMLSDAKIDDKVDFAAFEIPKKFLRKAVKRNQAPAAGGVFLDEALKATAPARDFVGSIAQAISGMLNGAAPTIEEAAEIAGASLRTFQRQLAADGLSYREVLDRVRFQGANQILGGKRVKISEIAFRLGYSDESNFIRAFRRWTGVSPHAYREEQISAAGG